MAAIDMISYRQGIRTKGFQLTVPAAGTQQTLSLSGLAKAFEGIRFSVTQAQSPTNVINATQLRVTLVINNDVVIDDDVPLHYGATQQAGITSGFPMFVPFPRALTGQDTILLRVTNQAGLTQLLNVTVYYRNEI